MISKSCQRVIMKNSHVAGFGILSGDKITFEESYEKKLGDTRIPKVHQEIQPRRRRGVPELLSHYSKKLSFSFHNIVRPHMFLREDML